MSTTNFFVEQKEQSKVKTAIVTKYFDAWSTIMIKRLNRQKIGYVDLFSGPGIFDDGELSTPMIILNKIISNPELAKTVVTIFNDKDKKTVNRLSENINNLANVDQLTYKPIIMNTEVGDELAEKFNSMRLIPTLAFIDPWGYKGLTRELIASLTKDFGCDSIFFFNYNRIKMGINNPKVEEHMENIFGEQALKDIRKNIESLSPEEKEVYIIEKLAHSLSDNKKNYVLPFKFNSEQKNMTSHYLIFVSKHVLGYKIMKDIMAKESSLKEDGVASFSYIPTKHIRKYSMLQLDLLSNYELPLDELGQMLLNEFSGKTLTVKSIFENHHVGKNFVLSNYKEALRRLENNKQIIVDPPAEKRRKIKGVITFGDNVKVTFP